MGNIYPDTGSCEVNVACVSTPDLIQAAKAVAGMSFIDNGDSYVCTGSLAKDAGGSGTPYFYTAHHCVYSQAIASTLNTFWNFQDSRCAGVTDPYRAQTVLTRGATYLDSESDNDHSLLQLKEQAPASATFLDWDTNDLVARASIVTIHQPNGDVKKVSYGQIASPATDNVSMSGDNGETIIHSNTWSVIWKTGVTEGGSSGAPLLTCDGKTCKMRGGLIGGSSVCRSDNGPDYFSKLSVALPRLKKWLATSSTAASPSIPTNLQLDCLFNWAEANYASLFAPPRSSSVSSTSYYYRQYSGTGAYLGSSTTDQHLYYIGPASARQLVDLGTISKWGNTAKCF